MEARDRKRLLVTLLEEIVLRVNREAGHAHVPLRWRGGRIDESELPLPARPVPARDSADSVGLVRRLAQLYAAVRIAETLRKQVRRAARGQTCSRKTVTSLRHRHGIEVFRGMQGEGGNLCLDRVDRQHFGVCHGRRERDSLRIGWLDERATSVGFA